jgi:hypothetical protein
VTDLADLTCEVRALGKLIEAVLTMLAVDSEARGVEWEHFVRHASAEAVVALSRRGMHEELDRIMREAAAPEAQLALTYPRLGSKGKHPTRAGRDSLAALPLYARQGPHLRSLRDPDDHGSSPRVFLAGALRGRGARLSLCPMLGHPALQR